MRRRRSQRASPRSSQRNCWQHGRPERSASSSGQSSLGRPSSGDSSVAWFRAQARGPPRTAPRRGVSEAVGPSLVAAGFATCGPGIFSHSGHGVTVEVGEEVVVSVDGIDVEDLSDWVRLQLEEVERFGAQLLEWTSAQRSAEPGFLEGGDGDGADAAADYVAFLPSPEELRVTADRALLIYTWGKALRKAPPADSQFNFNAGVLNGRGGGADLRTMNGLSEEVQRNIASCGLFPRWLEMVMNKIETSDLQCVSINCTKGCARRTRYQADLLSRLE